MGEDHASSYFAMRKISVENDGKGIPRICLNHEPVYLRGVLDQGYWPDGIYTPPSEEAILFDLREMKKSGFQMIRKHAKIEPDRWYYHCDRLGLLVWQDIVNGGEAYKSWYVAYAATLMNWLGIRPDRVHPGHVGRLNEAGKEEFCREIAQTAAVLREHPCMFAWTLFNEGWGQFETDRCVRILQKADPEHLIDAASGWFDQRGGDFRSVHFYYLTFRVAAEKKRAFVLSEFGGLPYHIPGHSNGERIYGYGAKSRTKEQLNRKYQKLMKNIERNIPKGLCATVYTQWTDIEDEVNGIYTCDREIRKIYNCREREKGLKLSEELQNEKEFPETENGGSKHAIDI
jgi:beta-galactosidase/beta-glucuronidase